MKPLDLIHVDFTHNTVSFARSGLVPHTFAPTQTSLKRLTDTLNQLSYESRYTLRPHQTGFNAYRQKGGQHDR